LAKKITRKDNGIGKQIAIWGSICVKKNQRWMKSMVEKMKWQTDHNAFVIEADKRGYERQKCIFYDLIQYTWYLHICYILKTKDCAEEISSPPC
jgi:hypothetical protein